MDTEKIVLDRQEARELYRKYKQHLHYSQPIDHEIMLAYQRIAQGRLVIRAIESVVKAGLDQEGLPKLALARATAEKCYLRGGGRPDSSEMSIVPGWRRHPRERAGNSFELPFPKPLGRHVYEAVVPLIPVHIRPRRGLANYHVLFEAVWRRSVPEDPFLLRRIGLTDMWVVVAMWDLTEVERLALGARL